MTGYIDFVLDLPSGEPLHVLACRHLDGRNLDNELGDVGPLRGLRRHPSGGPFLRAFRETVFETQAELLLVIRNPDLVLDEAVLSRLAADLSLLPDHADWAVAAGGGLGFHDRRYLALYASADPSVPDRCAPKPLVDILPDFYLLNVVFVQACLDAPWAACDAGLECSLVVEGYLKGRVSVFLAGLAAGINGHLIARDATLMKQELERQFGHRLPNETLRTLNGEITLVSTTQPSAGRTPPDLSNVIHQTVHLHCTPLSVSVVTRTRFDRPHLLRRLLTSISRARLDDMTLEVVLSTDQDPKVAAQHFDELQAEFIHLNLRLVTSPRIGFSRVTNLIRGLAATGHDHVVSVDDDDYLDISAFEALRFATFMGQSALVVTTSRVHAERWETGSDERPVLAESVQQNTYPASGWRRMFSGVNALPINALLVPRLFLLRRLEAFEFNFDLSEDYALALLILTAPDLPEVLECPNDFCNISIRGAENSVTMPDRRPWVRDITGYLSDLTGNRTIAGPGCWDLLCNSFSKDDPISRRAIADLETALARREVDLRILQQENLRLREELAMTRDLAS